MLRRRTAPPSHDNKTKETLDTAFRKKNIIPHFIFPALFPLCNACPLALPPTLAQVFPALSFSLCVKEEEATNGENEREKTRRKRKRRRRRQRRANRELPFFFFLSSLALFSFLSPLILLSRLTKKAENLQHSKKRASESGERRERASFPRVAQKKERDTFRFLLVSLSLSFSLAVHHSTYFPITLGRLAMLPMMLCEKGLARCPKRPSIGPSRLTRAWTANPTNATIASRPFLISLTALASELRPAGSSGKMAFFSPVFQAWKREVSR